MPTILITSMGGSGSNNLCETLEQTDTGKDFKVVGTHADPYELAKARIPDVYHVPRARDENAYLAAHQQIIRQHGVDLLIANSDAEVTVMARRKNDLPCRHLLPDADIVETVQDKFRFFELLSAGGCRVVRNIRIHGWNDIGPAAREVGAQGRFWVRPRKGSGSFGATWVESAEQARKWIELHVEMRDFRVDDFVFAPFLPGRDFNVSAMWQDGEFAVGKAVERLRYFYGDISLSGMGSTPSVTRTADDDAPVRATIRAVDAVFDGFGRRPHGYFNADLKCDVDGNPIVTEINIGRFPMISPHHDRIGRYNLLELYLRMAMDPSIRLPRGEFDLAPGTYVLRGVDTPAVFASEKTISAIPRVGV